MDPMSDCRSSLIGVALPRFPAEARPSEPRSPCDCWLPRLPVEARPSELRSAQYQLVPPNAHVQVCARAPTSDARNSRGEWPIHGSTFPFLLSCEMLHTHRSHGALTRNSVARQNLVQQPRTINRLRCSKKLKWSVHKARSTRAKGAADWLRRKWQGGGDGELHGRRKTIRVPFAKPRKCCSRSWGCLAPSLPCAACSPSLALCSTSASSTCCPLSARRRLVSSAWRSSPGRLAVVQTHSSRVLCGRGWQVMGTHTRV